MTIDEQGRIGIGTANPAYPLVIYSDQDNHDLSFQLSDNSFNQGINFRNSGGHYVWRMYRKDSGVSGRADLIFANAKKSTLTDLIDRVVFKDGGAVGIGTSNPESSALLEFTSTEKGFLPPRMTMEEVFAITNPSDGLIVYNADIHVPVYFNGTPWNRYNGKDMTDIEIGDYAFGGIVFYLDGNRGGLVCAINDQDYLGDYTLKWGYYDTEINGADGTAIGTGAQNTMDIEAGCTTAGIYADVCSNLTLNGHSDWFLPSSSELYEMYQNKEVIDSTAIANGGSAFLTSEYWSSSEFGPLTSEMARFQRFDTGNQLWGSKNLTNYVRAVRAF
jgi:hypothetical protein